MCAAKLVAVASALALTACAGHTWVPGPHQNAANFTEVSGRCKLVAMGADPGGGFVYAQGSPQFVGSVVGASVVAGAIGSGVRQQNTYTACMEANGFYIDDTAIKASDPRVAQVKELHAQLKACALAVRSKPVYAALQPHLLNLETAQYTSAQLADASIPTPAESQLLTQERAEAQTCQNSFATAVEQIFPPLGPVFQQAQADAQAIVAQLINRQITWGQAAQRSKQNIEAYAARLRDIHLT